MSSAEFRFHVACELAGQSFGVVSRTQLRVVGLTRHQVRNQVAAGRFRPLGSQAIHVLATGWWDNRSPIVAAVLNAGNSAWADGESALLLAGLRGWSPDRIHVSHARTTRAAAALSVEYHAPMVVPKTLSQPV